MAPTPARIEWLVASSASAGDVIACGSARGSEAATTSASSGPRGGGGGDAVTDGCPVIGGTWAQGWRRGWRLGACGTVYKAMVAATGSLVAVKVLPLPGSCSEDEAEAREAELRRLLELRHPNLAALVGLERAPGLLLAFSEYEAHGSMAALLSAFGPLRGERLSKAVRCTLDGLAYLHTRDPPVPHGGLRGSNLLVGADGQVRLADFGAPGARGRESVVNLAALQWTAPEVVQLAPSNGLDADSWSVGCALLEMATAGPPWGPRTPIDDVSRALSQPFPSGDAVAPAIPGGLPGACCVLARLCLRRAPGERLGSPGLLRCALLLSKGDWR